MTKSLSLAAAIILTVSVGCKNRTMNDSGIESANPTKDFSVTSSGGATPNYTLKIDSTDVKCESVVPQKGMTFATCVDGANTYHFVFTGGIGYAATVFVGGRSGPWTGIALKCTYNVSGLTAAGQILTCPPMVEAVSFPQMRTEGKDPANDLSVMFKGNVLTSVVSGGEKIDGCTKLKNDLSCGATLSLTFSDLTGPSRGDTRTLKVLAAGHVDDLKAFLNCDGTRVGNDMTTDEWKLICLKLKAK